MSERNGGPSHANPGWSWEAYLTGNSSENLDAIFNDPCCYSMLFSTDDGQQTSHMQTVDMSSGGASAAALNGGETFRSPNSTTASNEGKLECRSSLARIVAALRATAPDSQSGWFLRGRGRPGHYRETHVTGLLQPVIFPVKEAYATASVSLA